MANVNMPKRYTALCSECIDREHHEGHTATCLSCGKPLMTHPNLYDCPLRPTSQGLAHVRALEMADSVRGWWCEDETKAREYWNQLIGMYKLLMAICEYHVGGLVYAMMNELNTELDMGFQMNTLPRFEVPTTSSK